MPEDTPADLPRDLEAMALAPRRRETLYAQPPLSSISQLGGPAPRPEVGWRSCCLKTDRGAVVYIGQMLFAAALVAVCSVGLRDANGDCSKSSPYISLLSFLAGKVLSAIVGSG